MAALSSLPLAHGRCSETFATPYGHRQQDCAQQLRLTANSLLASHGIRAALPPDAGRNVAEAAASSSPRTHARRPSHSQSAAPRSQHRNTAVTTDDEASEAPAADSASAQQGGNDNGNGNGSAGQDPNPELLSRVKGSVEAVAGAVAEEAASVVDAVEKGVEVAATTVSSVGELPIDIAVQPLDSADRQKALTTVGFWVFTAVSFGLFVGATQGTSKASEFFAGYLLEQSLSVDNLLVFVLIFSYFKVPPAFQGRVLTYGLAGAVVFRGAMIGLGVATVQAFSAVNLVFAAILLFSSYKLLADGEDEDDDLSNNAVVNFCQRLIPVTEFYDGDKFYTTVQGVQKATPLLLTLAVVEISDVVFAVDSIPAVFGVTRDPFIVFSSNIFAILGLRSLYLLVSTSIADLHYLQPSVAIVLGFIGSKMLAEFFGLEVPTELSLAVVASVLGGGVLLSLLYPKRDGDESHKDD